MNAESGSLKEIIAGLIELKDRFWIHPDEPSNRRYIAILNMAIIALEANDAQR